MAASADSICFACKDKLSTNTPSLFAGNEIWHVQCFRCSECSINLAENYYFNNMKLYCKEHYMANLYSCHNCHTKITGPVMIAGGVKFHPECFMCLNCKRFIGEGDEYTLEERNDLFCSSCYSSIMDTRMERVKSIVLKGQHTIQHIRLKANEIGDKGITLQIDKSKNTEKHLASQVFGKINKPNIKRRKSKISVKSLEEMVIDCITLDIAMMQIDFDNAKEEIKIRKLNDLNMYSTTWMVRFLTIFKPQESPLKAGDKVIEVNGVLVSDDNIQEVSKLLYEKPTDTLHVTVERNQTEEDNGNQQRFNIRTSRSEERLLDKDTRSNSIPEDEAAEFKKRERSLSFFNFSIFKRTISDSSDWKLKAQKARQKKLEKSKHVDETETKQNKREGATLTRSRSLTEIQGKDETDQRDMVKAYATLHRAQSFKIEEEQNSQVFRPSDLVYGECIGKGFFGDVIKVTHSRTGEVMVMKQLKKVSKDSEETFLNEVQLLKSLKHPNVLGFIGIMYKNKLLHIITEFISGGTLRKLLKNKDIPLPWEQRVHFAKDIASGMAYLHNMNVIHRDLTSNNCLLRSDKHGMSVIVADFGLAKALQEDPCRSPRLSPLPCQSPRSPPPSNAPLSPTSPGRPPIPKKRLTVVGSPFWMAPEMMKGKGYDAKVDIFSFGIVLCEIIGRVKSDPDYLPRTFDFGLDENEFLKMFCQECPEPFYRLAFKACIMDPEKRPSFAVLEKWFEAIYVNLVFDIPLPSEIDFLSMPKPLMFKMDEESNR
eukprot:gene14100-15573_t